MRDATPQTDHAETPPGEVITAFVGGRATRVVAVSGGLSGAGLWRIDRGETACALRRTPSSELDHNRVAWLQESLRQAARSGADFVAEPISAADGLDCVRTPDGAWWTAARWRPGEPLSPGRSILDRRRAAAEALAAFHGSLAESSVSKGLSRAVEDRAKRLSEPPPRGGDELAGLAASLREPAARAIRRFAGRPLAAQPVQVDSRPEHFLLSGDEVTGLVDFAAMRTDTPAVDVARLAGELACHGEVTYAEHLTQVVSWYNETARNAVSAELVAALDLSGAVLAAENWRNWLAEGRVSMMDQAVSWRVATLRRRLTRIAEDG